jgi:uncharacterized protein YkwD
MWYNIDMKWFVFTLFTFALLFMVAFNAYVFSSNIVGVKTVNKNSSTPTALSAVSLSDTEYAVLEEINRLRTEFGLGPLSSNATLQSITLARNSDMQANQYYAHTSPNGISLKDFIPKGSGFACENLLLSESIEAGKIVREWMNSTSHRECLLSEKTTIAGVSLGRFDKTQDSTLNTQIVTFIASER